MLELKAKEHISKNLLNKTKIKIISLFNQIKRNISQQDIQPEVPEGYLYQIECKVNRLI